MNPVISAVPKGSYKPDVFVGGAAFAVRINAGWSHVRIMMTLLHANAQQHQDIYHYLLAPIPWLAARLVALIGLMAGKRWGFWVTALLFGYDCTWLPFSWSELRASVAFLPSDGIIQAYAQALLGDGITVVAFLYALMRLAGLLPRARSSQIEST